MLTQASRDGLIIPTAMRGKEAQRDPGVPELLGEWVIQPGFLQCGLLSPAGSLSTLPNSHRPWGSYGLPKFTCRSGSVEGGDPGFRPIELVAVAESGS